HPVCHAAQRAALLSAGAPRARTGAGRALRRHGGALRGARRRLVEPHRPHPEPLHAAARPDRERRRRLGRHARIPGRPPMIKRMVIMLILVGIVIGAIFGFQVFKAGMIKKFMAAASSPPQTVSASQAGYDQWQANVEAIGSLRAVNGSDLSLEVA